ncbi:Zn(II)2Cys6 transcription factor domain-containing protein [Aspergillus undulatus]|uniref:Zn(II)2Cys6 transcription factor domain-containing protein n=1 Tax=Aspergillus undulatus TaxID=1810928 RepID=UPI003CCDD41D
MSLRRRSCNACFRGRRKCNLAYPTCGTCQKSNKTCQYAYPPISASTPSASNFDRNLEQSLATLVDAIDASTMNYLETGNFTNFSSIARLCGPLGEVQPIEGSTRSWQWVIDELKSYSGEFARQGSTIFIHEQLYRTGMPQAMRTAFGVSGSSCLLTEKNRDMLFRVVDAEVTGLLDSATQMTLIEDLASLQALLLYQAIRLFLGSLQQRTIAEQQQGVMSTRALKLLTRSKAEIRNPTNQHEWVLAECIRRTAIIVYFLYGVNSVFREGICIGLPTLAKLPLSTALAYWDSCESADYESLRETISYETFVGLWLVSTPRRLDPFEKLLLVPCQGLDTVEKYDIAGATT